MYSTELNVVWLEVQSCLDACSCWGRGCLISSRATIRVWRNTTGGVKLPRKTEHVGETANCFGAAAAYLINALLPLRKIVADMFELNGVLLWADKVGPCLPKWLGNKVDEADLWEQKGYRE